MTKRIIFFPFTNIHTAQLKIVLTFFPAFEFLPMTGDFTQKPHLQACLGQGEILPHFLSQQLLTQMEQNLEQYMAWTRIHKGNEGNLKSLLKDTPYFTSESDVTSIKSKIRHGDDTKTMNKSLPEEGMLQQDLLFLKMAQLHDEQIEDIDLALNSLDTNHDNLILNLRGLDRSSNTDKETYENQGNHPNQNRTREHLAEPDYKDQGALMTQQRICAWSRCMAVIGKLNLENENPLFITTSQAVFDYLSANCKDVVNALDIDKIKVRENGCKNKSRWQQQFFKDLTTVGKGEGTLENGLAEMKDQCHFTGQIKFGIFSGNDINTLFNCSDKQISVCLIKLN